VRSRNSTDANGFSSVAGEGRFGFFHERPARFNEIAAGEALLYRLGAAHEVALQFVLHGLTHNVLTGLTVNAAFATPSTAAPGIASRI
jgi:hypothetical protein